MEDTGPVSDDKCINPNRIGLNLRSYDKPLGLCSYGCCRNQDARGLMSGHSRLNASSTSDIQPALDSPLHQNATNDAPLVKPDEQTTLVQQENLKDRHKENVYFCCPSPG